MSYPADGYITDINLSRLKQLVENESRFLSDHSFALYFMLHSSPLHDIPACVEKDSNVSTEFR